MLEIYHKFKLLGVSIDASVEDINKSYKKKAKLYHPDVNKDKDANNQFVKLKQAKDDAIKHKSNISRERYHFLKQWIKKINFLYEYEKISDKVYEFLKMNAACLKYTVNDLNMIDKNIDLLVRGLIDDDDFLELVSDKFGKNVS